MKDFPGKRPALSATMGSVLMAMILIPLLQGQQISLQALVTPSTMIEKDGHPITFALHGFIEFKSLSELFPYIEAQTRRWKDHGGLDEAARRELASDSLRRGIESRVISMTDERPLETLLTHTSKELRDALAQVQMQTKQPVPLGYAEAFLSVQEKWKHSLNCWSAAPSIPARVLSNWYPIEEGIQLYGATYDSTEHFWQAVKYHPDTTVADLTTLLSVLDQKDWRQWLARLDDDAKVYLPNAYAVEFLRHNLVPERLRWFRDQLAAHGLRPSDHVRLTQQRGDRPFRFTAFEEKVLWGDLADLFHLVYTFSPPDDPLRKTLADHHFDGIYLGYQKMGYQKMGDHKTCDHSMSNQKIGERRIGFISEEFRSLMLEIWKVKFLQMPRFRAVISSIPIEIRLSHFLNDGDSPDIPIPIYVEYLNQIRDLARK
jgi:hypothetical protein